MGKLPTAILRRPIAATPSPTTPTTSTSRTGLLPKTQTRHATFVQRPKLPYKFTQLVQLSDGSTFTVRTMSPVGVYKSDMDSRNHLLWQPSDQALHNIEVDESGKLAAFRERFGRDFDLRSKPTKEAEAEAEGPAAEGDEPAEAKAQSKERFDPFDVMEDLIKGYSAEDGTSSSGLNAKAQFKKDKKNKKDKK